MSRKNVLIALAVVLIGAGVVGANLYFKRDKGLPVTTDVHECHQAAPVAEPAKGETMSLQERNVTTRRVVLILNGSAWLRVKRPGKWRLVYGDRSSIVQIAPSREKAYSIREADVIEDIPQ